MTYNISSISSNTGNFFLSFTYTRYGSSILPFGEGAALGICICLVVKIVSNSTIFNWHMLEIKMALCNIFVILIKTKKASTASVEQNVNMLTRGDNYENYPASSGYPMCVWCIFAHLTWYSFSVHFLDERGVLTAARESWGSFLLWHLRWILNADLLSEIGFITSFSEVGLVLEQLRKC